MKLATFSRVIREKGIEDAVAVVKAVNADMGYTVFSLDIYGQVDPSQEVWFDELKRTFPYYVRYSGTVPYDQSVETLKKYFALLFPTYYEGEGFAGTLIDAFSAGVPVIASDWKYNSEIVNKDVGFVYKTGDNAELKELLKVAASDPNIILQKKRNCLHEAEKYTISSAIEILVREIRR